MSTEDNDNIYVIEEEDVEDIDTSPRNFAAYDDEEREEEEKEENFEGRKKSAIGILFKIMFNPVEGWKTLRRRKITVETLQSGCFYPLLALLALSKFADIFYSVNVTLTNIISEGIVAFVSYFFGFFCIQMILNWILPKDVTSGLDETFSKQYTIVALSTLALFSIVTDLLPMIWPILIFLPIWTLYIMFKGVRFFKLAITREMRFFIVSGATVIAVPLLIEWLLNSALPY